MQPRHSSIQGKIEHSAQTLCSHPTEQSHIHHDVYSPCQSRGVVSVCTPVSTAHIGSYYGRCHSDLALIQATYGDFFSECAFLIVSLGLALSSLVLQRRILAIADKIPTPTQCQLQLDIAPGQAISETRKADCNAKVAVKVLFNVLQIRIAFFPSFALPLLTCSTKSHSPPVA